MNATTQTINTHNGTIFGKLSTNSYLSMGSTTNTNVTVSLFDQNGYNPNDAYINAYSSNGNSTLAINGTALRDDVYVTVDGKYSQLILPLDYTGKFGVTARKSGVAVLDVEKNDPVVRKGPGKIRNTDDEADPYDDKIAWSWDSN